MAPQGCRDRALREDVGVIPSHGEGCLLRTVRLSRGINVSMQDFTIYGNGIARLVRDETSLPLISFYTCLSGVTRISAIRSRGLPRPRLSDAELAGYNPAGSMEIIRNRRVKIFTVSLEPAHFIRISGQTRHDLLETLERIEFNLGRKNGPHPLESIEFSARLVAGQAIGVTPRTFEDRLFLESKALEFLSLHLRQLKHLAGSSAQKVPGAIPLDKIKKACDILKCEMADPPGAKELARRVGMNHNQLVEGFRSQLGILPFEYLRTLRLESARNLLASQQFNVTQTALHVGFSSLSHFTKSFKEKFGITPKAWAVTTR
ncbi:MAG: helix-turn-helix domain-containing protein [Desulfobacterales bacterium]|nr:helix-turn-helix domain-containing protein [Desulfobacterales bacterium]